MAITQRMVIDCIKRELKLALPVRKKTNEFHQRPLWAWMRGAYISKEQSKIKMVLENKCAWPWTTQKASGGVFIERILSKKKLPWLQKLWLYDYVSRNYQGSYSGRHYKIRDDFSFPMKSHGYADFCEKNVGTFLDICIRKCGIRPHQAPLRLILSPELSILINLKFMEFYL